MINFIFNKSWKDVKNIKDWIDKIRTSRYNEEGKSRLTLAEFCNRPDFENKIKEILFPIFGSNIELESAEFERQTLFDDYGKGRMHDLFFKGSSTGIPICVGVEAKVVESFGQKIKSAYVESNTKAKRIEDLLNNSFSDYGITKDSDLSYQLLYSLAATAHEKDSKGIAVFAIFVFKTKIYLQHKRKASNNHTAFVNFMKKIDAILIDKKVGLYELYEAKIGQQKIIITYNLIDPYK